MKAHKHTDSIPGAESTEYFAPDIQISRDVIRKLNPKQVRFIAHYVQTGNGAAAARMAGYADRTAADLMSHPVISAEIDRIKTEIARAALEKGIISKDDASLLLSRLACEPDTEAKDKINAVKTLGDFFGWKAPKQHQHAVSCAIFAFLASVEGGGVEDFRTVPETEF